MSRLILGLDIRTDSVSAVLVRSSIKGNRIESHIHIPAPPTEAPNNRAIQQALETIAERMDIAEATCVASIPAEQVSFRNLSVPFKEIRKIRQMLPFEIESTVPLPVDQLLIDFHAVKAANETEILAALVEKSRMQAYLDLLTACRMDPRSVTVSGYPTVMCLTRLGQVPENWTLVDMGRHECTVFVIASAQLRFMRAFAIPDSTALGVDRLCQWIEQTLAVFEEIHRRDYTPEHIFLSGNGLEDNPSAEAEMAEILGTAVIRADITRQTKFKASGPTGDWNAAHLNNALALAVSEMESLGGINFRKGRFASRKYWEEHRHSLITSAILVGIILILACTNVAIDSYFMSKQIERLDHEINTVFKSAFPDVQRIVDPVQQMRTKIDELRKSLLMPAEGEKSLLTIDVLDAISRQIPKNIDVELQRLVMGSDTLQISGETDTFNTVDTIKSQLENDAIFKAVTISSANMNRSGKRVRFKLRVEL